MLKKIFGLIIKFAITVNIILLVGLIVMKTTFLDANYVEKLFKENDYYNALHKEVENNMESYLIPSGFDAVVLNDVFTEEIIEKDVKHLLKNIYSGKDLTLSNDSKKEQLKKQMNEYLNSHNYTADESELDRIIDQLLKVYNDELTLSNLTKFISSVIGPLVKLESMAFSILIITLLVLTVACFFLSKEGLLSIPLISTGLIYLATVSYIKNRIDIVNIQIMSEEFSNVLKIIINEVMGKFTTIAILSIIIGIIIVIIRSYYHEKKPRH